MIIHGGMCHSGMKAARQTQKNLKTKGRDLKYETSLRINTFLYDELDIYVRVWLILTLAKPVFVFI